MTASPLDILCQVAAAEPPPPPPPAAPASDSPTTLTSATPNIPAPAGPAAHTDNPPALPSLAAPVAPRHPPVPVPTPPATLRPLQLSPIHPPHPSSAPGHFTLPLPLPRKPQLEPPVHQHHEYARHQPAAPRFAMRDVTASNAPATTVPPHPHGPNSTTAGDSATPVLPTPFALAAQQQPPAPTPPPLPPPLHIVPRPHFPAHRPLFNPAPSKFPAVSDQRNTGENVDETRDNTESVAQNQHVFHSQQQQHHQQQWQHQQHHIDEMSDVVMTNASSLSDSTTSTTTATTRPTTEVTSSSEQGNQNPLSLQPQPHTQAPNHHHPIPTLSQFQPVSSHLGQPHSLPQLPALHHSPSSQPSPFSMSHVQSHAHAQPHSHHHSSFAGPSSWSPSTLSQLSAPTPSAQPQPYHAHSDTATTSTTTRPGFDWKAKSGAPTPSINIPTAPSRLAVDRLVGPSDARSAPSHLSFHQAHAPLDAYGGSAGAGATSADVNNPLAPMISHQHRASAYNSNNHPFSPSPLSDPSRVTSLANTGVSSPVSSSPGYSMSHSPTQQLSPTTTTSPPFQTMLPSPHAHAHASHALPPTMPHSNSSDSMAVSMSMTMGMNMNMMRYHHRPMMPASAPTGPASPLKSAAGVVSAGALNSAATPNAFSSNVASHATSTPLSHASLNHNGHMSGMGGMGIGSSSQTQMSKSVPIPIPKPNQLVNGAVGIAPPSKPTKTSGRRDSYTRFTAEEEAMLLEGVRVFGVGNWKKILNCYHFHWKRTAVDLKDKYRNMTRAKQRKMNSLNNHSNCINIPTSSSSSSSTCITANNNNNNNTTTTTTTTENKNSSSTNNNNNIQSTNSIIINNSSSTGQHALSMPLPSSYLLSPADPGSTGSRPNVNSGL